MTLDLLTQATFAGPAFTEPFVRYELEHELAARKLLPREAGAEGRELQAIVRTNEPSFILSQEPRRLMGNHQRARGDGLP